MANDDEIRELLKDYERALDAGDAGLATRCYMKDGISIGAGFPTLFGPDMPAAYAQMFKTVKMSVTFAVDEVVAPTNDFAWALTRSQGTQENLQTGQKQPESNREMFIFGREDGQWKIARYIFNTAP
jgi:uncharacterized protein (TIGR02246 family)